jgi:transcriptional regulator with XRE-family HTH domain
MGKEAYAARMGRPRQQNAKRSPKVVNLGRMLAMLGWTQTQLAYAAKVTLPYINQLATGRKKNPSYRVLEQISRAFGVSTAVLIDGRLDDAGIRRELSQAALRRAIAAGVTEHPKLARYVHTPEAPVTIEGWDKLARILAIADDPPHRTRPSTKPREVRRQ